MPPYSGALRTISFDLERVLYFLRNFVQVLAVTYSGGRRRRPDEDVYCVEVICYIVWVLEC